MSNPSLTRHPALDDWLTIARGGRVTVRTGKVDIGQRISTAVALIAAEELDVDLARIDVVRADTGQSPNEGITSGSNSMQESGNAIRQASVTARRHLLALAARALDAPPESLEVTDGLVRAPDSNRSITYWDLMEETEFGIPVDPNAPGKLPESYTLVGRKAESRDLAAIVAGKAHFVHDLALPGMKHARVVRPPHYLARLADIDGAVLERLAGDGIEVVRDGSFLAVVAADEYQAVRAAERLANAARWDMGDGLDTRDVYGLLTENERVSLPVVDGKPVEGPVPDRAPPPADAAATLTARYERPYLMHGAIAPSGAAAQFVDGKLTVWTHSQGIYVLRNAMAEALEVDPDDLRLIHSPGSGCYGHNGADDVALDAAIVARALPGTPVSLKWTRDDEHAWEPYGSAMAMLVEASIDKNGNVMRWSQESYSDTQTRRPRAGPNKQGAARLLASRFLPEGLEVPLAVPSMGFHAGIHRNLDPIYNFPSRRLVKNLVRDMPLRASALRTLGALGNVFAIESFMDELAEAAGADPVEFRLRHLDDSRGRDVLAAAAEMIGWGGTEPDEGRGRGIAFAQYKNHMAYAAIGVELSVNDAAEIRLHRAVIAGDAGQIVDADGLAAQMEGGFLQAASWALYEQVTWDRDGITSRDWESYPILRFDNVPDVETRLIDRPGAEFLGAGEASSGPGVAAIANALYRATGLRLRRIPFTPDAIRAAALN